MDVGGRPCWLRFERWKFLTLWLGWFGLAVGLRGRLRRRLGGRRGGWGRLRRLGGRFRGWWPGIRVRIHSHLGSCRARIASDNVPHCEEYAEQNDHDEEHAQ